MVPSCGGHQVNCESHLEGTSLCGAIVFLITDGLEAFGTLGSSFQALGGEEQLVSCVHVSSRVLSLCLK